MTGESCGGELKSGELFVVGSRSDESVSERGKKYGGVNKAEARTEAPHAHTRIVCIVLVLQAQSNCDVIALAPSWTTADRVQAERKREGTGERGSCHVQYAA